MKCSSVTIKALVLFLLIIFFFSCGGKVTTRPDDDEHEFTINGVVVKDMNLEKDIAYFAILKSGDPFDGAVVEVGSDTLESEGNGNYFLDGFPLFSYGQNVSISVSSAADEFNLSTSRQIPGSFQITDINHTTITSAQTHLVRVSYSISTGASGYFYSVVRPDGSDGFTTVIEPDQFGDTPIQRDAFYDELDSLITGTYQLTLVAYSSSFVYYPSMEFYLPGGLPSGNLSGANGTIGVGVVAASASIEAVSGE
ncbi:MAG: hypothetical protein WBD64_08015 [Candidatus Zixiibacteriota bacterium]